MAINTVISFWEPGSGASSSRKHNGEGGCSGNGHQPQDNESPRPWDTPPFLKKLIIIQ